MIEFHNIKEYILLYICSSRLHTPFGYISGMHHMVYLNESIMAHIHSPQAGKSHIEFISMLVNAFTLVCQIKEIIKHGSTA